MSDIFISYASEDRERAKTLAQALEGEGWSVWWDRMIPFGRPFDEVIEENLTAAKCALVLWTANSVSSKWVRSEAAEAEERGTLVPVLLDENVDLPLAFKLLQAADLSGWQPGVAHPEYDKLLQQIRALISGSAAPVTPSRTQRKSTPTPAETIARRRRILLGLLVLPSALVIAGALALMNWRVPTQIEMTLEVDRLSFTLAGSEPLPILDRAINIRRLSLEQLAQVELLAATLRPLEPAGAPLEQTRIVLQGQPQDRMALDVETEANGPSGRLSAISAQPGSTVTVGLRRGPDATFTLRIDGQALESSVLPAQEVLLTARNATLAASSSPIARWRAAVLVSVADPITTARSVPAGFTAVITPARPVQLLADPGAPISALELLKQTDNGGYRSAVVGPGRIAFVGSTKPVVAIDAGALLSVEDMRNATLAPIKIQPREDAINVRFTGIVDKLHTRTDTGQITDLRLSAFDKLWYGARGVLLLVVAAWAAPVALGIYKFYRTARAS